MASEFAGPEPYPLYNATFTLHRLSPLYVGTQSLNDAVLRQHARRFREILVGDVMRGVRVGLASENDPVSAAGKLIAVTWRLLPTENSWRSLHDGEDTTLHMGPDRGIRVAIEYEKITYSAILLKEMDEKLGVGGTTAGEGFQHFPLLLTKMPGSLREAFVHFLSETFDVRVTGLSLSSKDIINSFEKYISDVSTDEDGEELEWAERSKSIRRIIRETEIFIGFDLPGGSNALKTIEIHLTREDLPRLVSRGKGMEGQEGESAFVTALTTYVKVHLAMNMKHERVKVTRIACGAFVLGEGRVKLPEPTGFEGLQNRATNNLVGRLLNIAARSVLKSDS